MLPDVAVRLTFEVPAPTTALEFNSVISPPAFNVTVGAKTLEPNVIAPVDCSEIEVVALAEKLVAVCSAPEDVTFTTLGVVVVPTNSPPSGFTSAVVARKICPEVLRNTAGVVELGAIRSLALVLVPILPVEALFPRFIVAP